MNDNKKGSVTFPVYGPLRELIETDDPKILKTESQPIDSSAYWKDQFDKLLEYVRPLVEPQNSERLEDLELRLLSKTNKCQRLHKAVDYMRDRAEKAEKTALELAQLIDSGEICSGLAKPDGTLVRVYPDDKESNLRDFEATRSVRVRCIIEEIE